MAIVYTMSTRASEFIQGHYPENIFQMEIEPGTDSSKAHRAINL